MTRLKQYSIDWISVILYLLLISIGCLSIYSSSYNPSSEFSFLSLNTLLGKQIFFIILALSINIFILLIDVKIIIRLAYIAYFLSIISLILVLIIGKEVGGAKAWFDFGKFGLQPAEFAKFGTILAISKFIQEKNIYLKNLNDLIKICTFILIPCMLILKQPDAGSALIYGSLLIVFFREGIPLRYVVSIGFICLITLLTLIQGANNTIIFLILCSIVLSYLLKRHKQRFIPILIFMILSLFVINIINYSYENILQPHQKERIDIILGKEKNDLGSGYNLKQSLIAIGSGGFIGKGYLEGTQTKFNFVPEQNTDFIFCTIGEEFGFLGSFLIILLFSILIIRVFLLSEKQTSRFGRIFGYSVGSVLFGHVIINISMTIGLMPVIGIPLPFISAGGSSMIAFSMLLFTFIKLNTHRIERF